MIKFLFFTVLFLSSSVFASGSEEAYKNEPTICRSYVLNSFKSDRGWLCKPSKDGQRILLLSPELTLCPSQSFVPNFPEPKYKDLIWVLKEFNAKDQNLLRSTKLCSLNIGSLNPPQTDFHVFSFGEMDDGQLWMAYRQIGYYLENEKNPGEPFKIVKFSPNGSELRGSDLQMLYKLKSYTRLSEGRTPTPYGYGMYSEYPREHTPVFTYLEHDKEFLFYTESGWGEGEFRGMNSQVKFTLPRSTDQHISGVDVSASGDRVVYQFFSGYGYETLPKFIFGVFDLKTGKSIYEYPGEKLELSKARFVFGSEQYVHFRGLNDEGAQVAYVIDIVSGEVKAVSPWSP